MISFFNSFLYQPLLGVLHYIYGTVGFGDLGVSIIVLTLAVRVVLFPLFHRSAKDQTILQGLQPQIKQIQEKYKDNKEKQAQEILALYKQHKTNPFSGLILLVVQIPIFLAIFYVFKDGAGDALFDSHSLLGLINLQNPNLILALFAGLTQYFQLHMASAKNPAAPKFMEFLGPIITLVVLWRLPAALALYWGVSNTFSLFQQWHINRKLSKTQ